MINSSISLEIKRVVKQNKSWNSRKTNIKESVLKQIQLAITTNIKLSPIIEICESTI